MRRPVFVWLLSPSPTWFLPTQRRFSSRPRRQQQVRGDLKGRWKHARPAPWAPLAYDLQLTNRPPASARPWLGHVAHPETEAGSPRDSWTVAGQTDGGPGQEGQEEWNVGRVGSRPSGRGRPLRLIGLARDGLCTHRAGPSSLWGILACA